MQEGNEKRRTKVLVQKHEGKNNLGDLCLDGKIILKFILQKNGKKLGSD
jgi:hypothetical protein